MKVGISTATFFNTAAPESVFDLLRNMRCDTAEVCLNTFSEYEKPYVDRLAALKGGINVISVSPLSIQFEPQLFSPNQRVRSDAELIFRKVCYACFAFGARYYTFRGPINLNNDKEFDYIHLAQRYSQLCDIAATYGIGLSLKNMRWSYASKPAFIEKITDLCPRLFISLDLYNAESVGYDIREFLKVCPPQRISMIEVADFIKTDWCLPGRGKFNFSKLFAELDKRKITAPVLIAARSDCYADFVQVRDSFEWLCSKYNKTKG